MRKKRPGSQEADSRRDAQKGGSGWRFRLGSGLAALFVAGAAAFALRHAEDKDGGALRHEQGPRNGAIESRKAEKETPENGRASGSPVWGKIQNNAAPLRSSPLMPRNAPKIAVIIDDLGMNPSTTRLFEALPFPLTGSFLPYAETVARQAREMRQTGKEVMVHLPMQPKGSEADPGPNALLENLPPEEFQRRLLWNLDRIPDASGVNNHMGSLLTEDRAVMARVMEILAARGLFFIDSATTAASAGLLAAREHGLAEARRNVFLDNVRDKAAIMAQLGETERFAVQHGQAIAIGHPYPETAEALGVWAREAQARGFRLVLASALLTRGKPASPDGR